MNTLRFALPLILAASAALLSACGGSTTSGNGEFSLGITDAPVDGADAVVVTFTDVELLAADNTVRRKYTFTTPQSVDLLDFQGAQQRFLVGDANDGVELPAGEYDSLRLTVASQTNANCNSAKADPNYPNYVLVNGVKFPLIVPSGGSSGLKVRGPLIVAAGERAAYTVDFDLRKSLAERGATGCYNLRPVLRVVDNAEVGTLTGTVDPALLSASGCTADADSGTGAAVYVYEGTVTPDDFDGLPAGTANDRGPDPVTTALLTRVPATGTLTGFSYEVGFLLTGAYTVAFTCQAGDDVPPESVPPPATPTVVSDNPLVFVQPQAVTVTRTGPNTVNFSSTAN